MGWGWGEIVTWHCKLRDGWEYKKSMIWGGKKKKKKYKPN